MERLDLIERAEALWSKLHLVTMPYEEQIGLIHGYLNQAYMEGIDKGSELEKITSKRVKAMLKTKDRKEMADIIDFYQEKNARKKK
jgi:hypothetical protein